MITVKAAFVLINFHTSPLSYEAKHWFQGDKTHFVHLYVY